MYAELTVKWAVTPAKAVELYRLAGSEDAIQQRLVFPDSREIVRNVFARHTSEAGLRLGPREDQHRDRPTSSRSGWLRAGST